MWQMKFHHRLVDLSMLDGNSQVGRGSKIYVIEIAIKKHSD